MNDNNENKNDKNVEIESLTDLIASAKKLISKNMQQEKWVEEDVVVIKQPQEEQVSPQKNDKNIPNEPNE